MKCPICQTEVLETSLFCTICGARLYPDANAQEEGFVSASVVLPLHAVADGQASAFAGESKGDSATGELSSLIDQICASTRGHSNALCA